MNKLDFISHMTKEFTLSKEEAKESLDIVLSSIASALKDNKEVKLLGFGAFTKHYVNSRKSRNPRTGEEINIK